MKEVTTMAMPMPFDARMARDAQKWGRWSWKRRLLKRVMDPERARQMSDAHAAAAMMLVAQQARQEAPAFWRASSFIKGL